MPELRLHACFVLFCLLLVGCSSTSRVPPFSASGYLADRGAVRIWRKNSAQDRVHLRTLYTPFNQQTTETTDYLWQGDTLLSVARTVSGDSPNDVTLRFDAQGHLSFMQRQLAGKREPLDNDAIELYKFDAQRMLARSNALQDGRIRLKQGIWSGGRQVESCEGTRLTPDFDRNTLNVLAGQHRLRAAPLLISWLEAPEGSQLLRVAAGEGCDSQPREADF